MTKKFVPIGIDKFAHLMRSNCYFADKTFFLQRLIDDIPEGQVLLFTRPRRFGKTLTMDMVRCFFDCRATEAERGYFANLNISKAGERYLAEQNRYPVLFLTFGAIKPDSWESFCRRMSKYLASICDKFSFLLEEDTPTAFEREMLKSWCTLGADIETYQGMLSSLSQILHRHYGQPVILLIDEYDSPLKSAHSNGYYKQAIGFMRDFLTDGLKVNNDIKFALVTGVLRISRESIFSGLNNLDDDTVLNDSYADVFGFTPEEAESLLEYYGHGDKIAELRQWYDGYLFGSREMYNPWSVLKYVKSGCTEAVSYWLNTSANEIIMEACQKLESRDKKILRDVLNYEPINTKLNMSLTYSDSLKGMANICALLVMTGYLKAEPNPQSKGDYLVRIPNREVGEVYSQEIINRFMLQLKEDYLSDLMSYLNMGDFTQFGTGLRDFIFNSCSYYDDANPGKPRPEMFYHSLVMGLTAALNREYHIKSNLESGLGRPDLLFIPRDGADCSLPVIVMEFKRGLPGQDLADLARQALEQAKERRYGEDWAKDVGYGRDQATERRVLRFGMAFRGKEMELCQESES